MWVINSKSERGGSCKKNEAKAACITWFKHVLGALIKQRCRNTHRFLKIGIVTGGNGSLLYFPWSYFTHCNLFTFNSWGPRYFPGLGAAKRPKGRGAAATSLLSSAGGAVEQQTRLRAQ